MRRSFAACTMFMLTAPLALAQLGNLAQLPNVEYNPLLVINPQVQKELHVAPALAPKLQQTFFSEALKIISAVAGGTGKVALTQEQRTRRTLAGIDEMQAKLAGMLNPTQRVRLRQLTLQSIGPAAALQPKVASALGLTTAQRVNLEQSIANANAPLAGSLDRKRPMNQWSGQVPEMTRLQNQAKAEGNRALMATLTPAQKTKWKAMLGRPFPLTGLLGAGNISGLLRGR